MARRDWVVAARKNPTRHFPGEDEIDPSHTVAVGAKATDLRQEIGRRPLLRQRCGGPRAGHVVGVNIRAAPVKSQVEASNSETRRGLGTPDPSVRKSASANALTARSRHRPFGSRSSNV